MRKILARYRQLSSQISAGQTAAAEIMRRAQMLATNGSLSIDERRAAVSDLRRELDTQKTIKANLTRNSRSLEATILRLLNDKIRREALARQGRVRPVPCRRPTIRAKRSQTSQATAHGADSGGLPEPDPEPPRRPHAYTYILPILIVGGAL